MSLVIAMSIKDGLLLVADRRVIYNNLTGAYSDTYLKKIKEGNNKTAVALAGNEGRASVIIETIIMPKLKNIDSILNESLIKKIAQSIQDYKDIFIIRDESIDLQISIMICSLGEKHPIILTFNSLEFVPELHKNFWLIGTTFRARGIIEHGWHEGITKEDAIELGIKALVDTQKYSIYVGGIPQIVEILSNGYKEIDNEKIKEVYNKIEEENGRTHKSNNH